MIRQETVLDNYNVRNMQDKLNVQKELIKYRMEGKYGKENGRNSTWRVVD